MWLNICNITFKRADVSGSEHIPLHPTSYIFFSCLGLFFSETGFKGIFVWLRPFKWRANDCSTWAGKRVHGKHQTIVKQEWPDTHTQHNEKWWQTVYILKAGINSKHPPLSMSHFPLISVLDWISTKAAKHLWGSRCAAKDVPLARPGEHHILWVATHFNEHTSHLSQAISTEGSCVVDRRGFSFTSIHHCSDLKLTVFQSLMNVNHFICQ